VKVTATRSDWSEVTGPGLGVGSRGWRRVLLRLTLLCHARFDETFVGTHQKLASREGVCIGMGEDCLAVRACDAKPLNR
jgi:hypothetical protein